jgi:hypothetical protein
MVHVASVLYFLILLPSQYIAKCNMIYSTDFISPMCKNIKRYNVERLGSGITVRVRAVYS